MLAYMNEESLRRTSRERKACYYSRSRQSLWLKGETSGHFQEIIDIKFDCDQDALLLTVKQIEMACHENHFSCFLYDLTCEGFTVTGKPEVRPEPTFGRGKGLGKIILSFLAKLAIDRRCGRLEWWCLDWNEPSIKFLQTAWGAPDGRLDCL